MLVWALHLLSLALHLSSALLQACLLGIVGKASFGRLCSSATVSILLAVVGPPAADQHEVKLASGSQPLTDEYGAAQPQL